jgi:hypothetical protein
MQKFKLTRTNLLKTRKIVDSLRILPKTKKKSNKRKERSWSSPKFSPPRWTKGSLMTSRLRTSVTLSLKLTAKQ